tara:strand:- start:17022 stop:18467 length:1446 start_codon:yes stop_codon:yes gene_type:complete
MSKSRLGVYGLGVMGKNLALNFEDKGYRVSLFNRNAPGEQYVVDEFLAFEGVRKNFKGTSDIKSFVESLDSPRKILMMVKAGEPVDMVIDELTPYLDQGDIIIDGGNSNFEDTNRRVDSLKEKGILFVGMGVSGGEEGARNGPSLMPGGNKEAWPHLREMLESISAKAFDDSPCCAWIGNQGAGHFIKMVHNGIEYADMQIISEAYHFMKVILGMKPQKMADTFSDWCDTELDSYLIEITANILKVKDEQGEPLLDKILDSAGQKGTGKWTAVTSLEQGVALPVITQAVYSRFFSSLTDLRRQFANRISSPILVSNQDRALLLHSLAQALFASRMVAYAEGFFLITNTGKEFNWGIDPASAARIWQGGCIIRSDLLNEIQKAYTEEISLEHLFLSNFYTSSFRKLISGWRKIVSTSVNEGLPMPAMSAALAQYDTLRSEKLPANLIQAQRDYFGAHTYERVDRLKGKFFHTDWIEKVKSEK